jgi:hypothetical protein
MELTMDGIRSDPAYSKYHKIIDNLIVRPDAVLDRAMATNGIYLLYNSKLISLTKDNLKYSILHELEHINLEHSSVLAEFKALLDEVYNLATMAAEVEVALNLEGYKLDQDIVRSAHRLENIKQLLGDNEVSLENVFRLLTDNQEYDTDDNYQQARAQRMFRNISE